MVIGISPFKICFNAIDFDDALLDIESLLKDYNVSKGQQTLLQTTLETRRNLETIYAIAFRCLKEIGNSKPDKQLTFLLADITCKYAQTFKEENPLASKQILLVSFNLHLYSIGFLNECIDMRDYSSLDDLKSMGYANPNAFSSMEQLASSLNSDALVATAYKDAFAKPNPQKHLVAFASALRWLGHAYQDLDAYKASNPVYDQLFKNIYLSSEALFLLADCDESRYELGDMYYEAWPFMHKRQHASDEAGATAHYDKAYLCNQSKEMQVRIANKRFLAILREGNEDEALIYLRKAVTMAETLDDNEPSRFLLAKLYYNISHILLRPKNFDIERAEILLNRAARYAAQSRETGRDHIYFAIYDMRIAEFKIAIGKFHEAKINAERALETLKKFPHSNQPQIFKAEALQSYIDKILKLPEPRVLSPEFHEAPPPQPKAPLQ